MARTRLTARKSAIPQYRYNQDHYYQPEVEEEEPQEVEMEPEFAQEEAPVLNHEGEEEEPAEEVDGVEEQGQGSDSEDPEEPSDPEDEDAEPDNANHDDWEVTEHHHDGGDARLPRLLRRFFHFIHYPVEIDYVGRRRSHSTYSEEWDVSVHIKEADYIHRGQVEVAVHYALATRSTYAAGIDDATKRALSAWRYERSEYLTNTAWEQFPRRRMGAVGSVVTGFRPGMSQAHIAQAKFNTILNTTLDDTLVELQDFRKQLTKARRETRALKAKIQGQSPVAVEDDENWATHSPSPKRTRYGSASSRTRVLD